MRLFFAATCSFVPVSYLPGGSFVTSSKTVETLIPARFSRELTFRPRLPPCRGDYFSRRLGELCKSPCRVVVFSSVPDSLFVIQRTNERNQSIIQPHVCTVLSQYVCDDELRRDEHVPCLFVIYQPTVSCFFLYSELHGT